MCVGNGGASRDRTDNLIVANDAGTPLDRADSTRLTGRTFTQNGDLLEHHWNINQSPVFAKTPTHFNPQSGRDRNHTRIQRRISMSNQKQLRNFSSYSAVGCAQPFRDLENTATQIKSRLRIENLQAWRCSAGKDRSEGRLLSSRSAHTKTSLQSAETNINDGRSKSRSHGYRILSAMNRQVRKSLTLEPIRRFILFP